jgi:phosphatidylserine/phosphatidylglycerophosphate/cardiolipin synthase-like enzyme
MTKSIFVLGRATVLLVCLSLGAIHSEVRVFFGPTEGKATPLRSHFLEFLSSATESLDAAFFEIRDEAVVEGFIQAHERGVEVRLIVDSNYFYARDPDSLEIDHSKRNPFIKTLLNAGIKVIDDNRRSGLMHNKFCIADQKRVWTGSYNLTDRGTSKNENNAASFDSLKLARIYAREFREMFEEKRFGITSPSTIDKQKMRLGSRKIEVFFAPEDNPVLHLYEHIAKAQDAIYFMQFAMTANEIGDLLVKKHTDGLVIKGLFDRILYRSTGPYAEFAKLTRAGIPVMVYDSAIGGKLHHKVFILDPNGEHPKVIFGSLNVSANGNSTNDENVLVIEDRKFTQAFYKKFRSLFGRMSRVVASFKQLQPVQAATLIDRLTLMISSNGVITTHLKIQFPPRWEKEQDRMGLKIFRFKDGKAIDTTNSEDFRITNRDLYINSANLAASGEGALLMVRMTDVLTPEIPGLYNLYIQAKARRQAFYPLKEQPVLEVIQNKSKRMIPTKLLEELLLGKHKSFFLAAEECLEESKCSFLSESFLHRARQILQQRVLIESSPTDQEALEMLMVLRQAQKH